MAVVTKHQIVNICLQLEMTGKNMSFICHKRFFCTIMNVRMCDGVQSIVADKAEDIRIGDAFGVGCDKAVSGIYKIDEKVQNTFLVQDYSDIFLMYDMGRKCVKEDIRSLKSGIERVSVRVYYVLSFAVIYRGKCLISEEIVSSESGHVCLLSFLL